LDNIASELVPVDFLTGRFRAADLPAIVAVLDFAAMLIALTCLNGRDCRTTNN